MTPFEKREEQKARLLSCYNPVEKPAIVEKLEAAAADAVALAADVANAGGGSHGSLTAEVAASTTNVTDTAKSE